MLQIRLLGQFDIRLDGKRVTIPTRAAQSLLAYLVLTAGTPHRREKLAGIFWPDTTDENARKNLRQELWRIRKALSAQQSAEGDTLLADEFTLTFNRNAEYWLDVSQMERPDLDLGSLIANLSLYQSELLPGFYDEWITLERERIQAVFEARMEGLLEQLITAERWIAVQEWGERWLTLSGAREPAYRALMLASGVRGDKAKVASLYQRCTRELMEQLGVEPSPETRALYDDLAKGTKMPPHTAAQPSGTITFLFTDIEGSTRLLEKMGDQYAAALGEHHEILRAAIQKWNGREVDTQGDAFFVTFTRAIDAVQCAAEAQRALTSHSWQDGESLRVRMGLHTGEPLIASTGYVGMDVHRAARIGDAGHGGQILLSQTTRELVVQDLPEGMTIRDLGEHRLKDMKYPSSIYQLVVDGLPAEFPTIRTKFSGAEAPTPGEAPFKGLQFFDVDDSELFFGREVLTAKLIDRLKGADFLSVIIGASGSGKSSLVRAGLVPVIKTRNAGWQVHILTPTAHPLEALAFELTRDSESVTATATLVDDLSKDPRSLYYFLSRRTQSHHKLLVIDQFEELFTLCRDEFEREAFIDNLLAALAPPSLPLGEARKGEGSITLVITLRADFYAHLAQYPELRDAVAQGQEYIGPMTSEELRRAIEEPAQRGHWEFEPGLVDLILRDVGDEPGALPLLSHALLETWKRRAGHTLTLKGYADAGGVHGAIAHTAESLYQTFSPDEQTITRNILLRLTEFGDGTEDTRRRASFDELMSHAENPDGVRAVLNKLADARLVTLSEDTAEVAHEALIREWPQLREWLSQDREGIILHRRLTEAAQEWELLERDAGSVYRGARLAQANEWSALNPNVLNAQERLFLDASNRQAKQEEQEREEGLQRELDSAKELAETQRQSASRLRTRNRVITTVGTIAIILALLAGTFGVQSNQHAVQAEQNAQAALNAEAVAVANADAAQKAEAEAIRQQRITLSRELAGYAINDLDVDPERSILLAMQAVTTTYAVDGTTTKEAAEALHRAVLNSRLRLALYPDTDNIGGLAFRPDGKQFATGGYNGQIKIWELPSGKELFSLPGHEGSIYSVAFSPDGSELASASGDGTSKVWDLDTQQLIYDLHGHTDEVVFVSFNHDGKRIVTASVDGTASVWDAENGQAVLTLTGHEGPVYTAQFSPDGTRIVTSGDDLTVRVWDAATGKEIYKLSGFPLQVTGATFSPDGKYIATGGDESPKIWDAATGQEIFTLPGKNDHSISGMAFTPDSKYVAMGDDGGGIVHIWEVATGREYLTFSVGNPIDGFIAISPGCVTPPAAPYVWCGLYLATGTRDGVIKFWDISPTGAREVLTVPGYWHCINRDGTLLITAADGVRLENGITAVNNHLWRLPPTLAPKPADALAVPGQELFSYRAGDFIRAADTVFSADCARSASINLRTLNVTITDTASGKELLKFKLPEAVSLLLGGASLSPDGTRLATAGQGNTATVWDLTNGGKELLTLKGHTDLVFSVAFSPDGKLLATASDDFTAKVWDAETGQERFTLPGHTFWVGRVVFSPDGLRLGTGSLDRTAKIWDLTTGKELMTLTGAGASVWAIAFSPDGRWIATGNNDNTLRLWDARTGEQVLTLPIAGPVFKISFTPDSVHLVTSTVGNTSQVYSTRIEDLIALAKSRVTRSLTTEECQQYLHVEACPAEP
jgi:WD40 repeat protein/DNA-binding SARP family transcriptional activator